MAIQALALLHTVTLQTDGATRVDRLDDAVLVHTGAEFAAEPEDLAEALIARVGAEALADHDDPRGILFIPDVAAPQARTYEAVVAEVGEGGVWAELESADEPGQDADFGALLGNVFAQLPPSLLAAASSAASGDRGSLDQVAAQVQALLGSSPALQSLAGQLSGMLGQAGGTTSGPQPGAPAELASLEDMFASFGGGDGANAALRSLASNMQAELERDPEKMQQLAQSLLGADAPDTSHAKKK
ncbi:MAG: hypothetical protein JWN48_4357 [Myxococcaceae bacterium]|nr:hypothetical protein [Myxococcaceae bacterium]